MDAYEFIQKFYLMSEGEQKSFLAFLYGACQHDEIKHFEVIKEAFEYAEQTAEKFKRK